MRKWVILSVLCLAALFYPCDELPCWDTAGARAGTWSETSCFGNDSSGTWTGYVTEDCRFFGTSEWKSIAGTIDPSTQVLTATGKIREQCGTVTMTGTFTSNLTSVSGNYNYPRGGCGSFAGRIQ